MSDKTYWGHGVLKVALYPIVPIAKERVAVGGGAIDEPC